MAAFTLCYQIIKIPKDPYAEPLSISGSRKISGPRNTDKILSIIQTEKKEKPQRNISKPSKEQMQKRLPMDWSKWTEAAKQSKQESLNCEIKIASSKVHPHEYLLTATQCFRKVQSLQNPISSYDH